jgi:hypothetical protein
MKSEKRLNRAMLEWPYTMRKRTLEIMANAWLGNIADHGTKTATITPSLCRAVLSAIWFRWGISKSRACLIRGLATSLLPRLLSISSTLRRRTKRTLSSVGGWTH